jgi:integrase
VKNHHALLSAILRAAVDQGLRPDNPAARAKLSRGLHREGVFLSSEEFDALLRFIPDEHRPLVVFLAGTGCRWGEATALRWSDLNLKAATPTVRIERAWKRTGHGAVELGPPKSPRSRRTISLPPEVVAELPERGKPSDLIFTAPRGGMVWHGRFNADVWRPAVAAANDVERCAELGVAPIGKEPNIHDLRHTHASWLIAGGAPLPFVQARLGHEKIDTTVGTYGHLLPDAHVEMARIIGGAMQLSPKRALEASQVRS